MSLPWLGLGTLSLAVGSLLFVGYPAATVVAMLATGSTIIDAWTAFFAFTFATQPLSPLLIGAGAIAVFLIFIGVIYFTTVRRTSTGNYEGARAASLFFGVILILVSLASFAAFLGYPFAASASLLILPALFFLMGYGKMGEVIARYGPRAVLSDSSPNRDSTANSKWSSNSTYANDGRTSDGNGDNRSSSKSRWSCSNGSTASTTASTASTTIPTSRRSSSTRSTLPHMRTRTLLRYELQAMVLSSL